MTITRCTLAFTAAMLALGSTNAHANRDDVDLLYSYEDALDQQPEEVANKYGDFESAPYLTPAAAAFELKPAPAGVGGPVETSAPFKDVAALDDGDRTYGRDGKNIAASATRWDVAVGLGVASIPEYSGSNENDWYVLPFIRAQYRLDEKNHLFASPYEGIGFKHLLTDSFQFGVKTGWRKGRDSSDDASLAGMPDVDTAIEAGPFVRYTYHRLTIGLDAKTDLNGKHDGYTIEPMAMLSLPTPINRLRASIGADMVYGSGNFMDAYYRVLPAQATATRRAFEPGSGFASMSGNTQLTYLVDENWFVTGSVKVTRLLGDAADSPLTRQDTNVGGFMAVGYQF
jgi:outer membrane scaffolding protein for murein synthesis (MipA/OmpV family)